MSAHPEADLQSTVRAYLNLAMPDVIWWTASLAGVRLSIRAAVKAKAAGR